MQTNVAVLNTAKAAQKLVMNLNAAGNQNT